MAKLLKNVNLILKIIYEQNDIGPNFHRMFTYTQQKFRLETVYGQTGDDPWPSLQLPLVGGLAPVDKLFNEDRSRGDSLSSYSVSVSLYCCISNYFLIFPERGRMPRTP